MKKLLLSAAIPLLLVGCAVTPDPFDETELEAQATDRAAAMTSGQEAVVRPISLYEAMARAIKYNLDYKVELMEQALRSKELNLSRYDLLPQIVAGAGYNGRSNFSGASSSQLLGPREVGAQSLVSSTSAERDIFASDISLSYDLLDFGLSYIRAKQAADEVMIANERKRSVINRVVEDVRTAYWRAVSAERLIRKLTMLESDIEGVLQASESAYDRRKTAPLSTLTYQRELLTIKEEIQNLQQELAVSKQQLAALINIDPGEPFELVLPSRDNASIDFTLSPGDMVRAALRNRPELREASYRKRINEKEATAALLDLLPSLRAYGGFNYDSNDFLFNNNWAGWGARASWNLVEAFRYPARKATVKAQGALLRQRELAVTMAVVTQVHVSRTRFELARRKVDTIQRYHGVQTNILDQIRAGYDTRRVSKQTFIREQMNKLVAEAKFDIALADLQNAFANMHSSMGFDPFGIDVTGDETVDQLTAKLRDHWGARGDRLAEGDQLEPRSRDVGIVSLPGQEQTGTPEAAPATISAIPMRTRLSMSMPRRSRVVRGQ
ncbi:MAG: TolC family protein [Pseudomonadota bacterium]